jgi:lysophospholipase L1-like esterase
VSRLELLWWTSLATLPVLLPQALYARLRTLRLPEAGPPWQGVCGTASRRLRLAVVGDSTVAGVGAGDQRLAVAGRTAAALAEPGYHCIEWHAFGRNGATIADIQREFVEPAIAFSPDIVLLSVGVNDTTAMTSRRRWQDGLVAVANAFYSSGVGTVAVSRLPPMHLFSALPQPLRAFLGMRARILDQDLQRLAAGHRCLVYLDVRFEPRPEFLAEDGYHPSAAGCAAWGNGLAAGLRERLDSLNPDRVARAD